MIDCVFNHIMKYSSHELLNDQELTMMLYQLLYWDKYEHNEYSQSRIKKLTDVSEFIPIFENIGTVI